MTKISDYAIRYHGPHHSEKRVNTQGEVATENKSNQHL